ncbi:hypothetical protein L6164_025323 [Bauhinia variegata]|uniref:Uncharacterized protein n=1 Tax=Bauhinia variegata TaxID=167791 RepID=A0ACB9M1K7_BAUVA|nr:hypothetical protein L6164_025323 [Bauhinia variegata]
MLRFVLAFTVLSSLLFTSSFAQTCSSYSFPGNRTFALCRDLPQLSSYLHWNYEQATGKLDLAYRHGGITSTDKWVSWAINPSNNLEQSMIGAQALVAFPQSNGTTRVYTSNITGYGTTLAEGTISYNVSGLNATHQNNEVIIFATLILPSGNTTLVHLWQEGPLSGSTPQRHEMTSANLNAKGTLDLLTAQAPAPAGSGAGAPPPTGGGSNGQDQGRTSWTPLALFCLSLSLYVSIYI